MVFLSFNFVFSYQNFEKKQILKQVINHGVPEGLMNDTMNLYKEFFDMPIEDKERVFSDDSSQSTRLYTSGLHFAKEEVHYWKDTLKHPVHPVEDYNHTWPEKPTRYR